MNTNQRRTKSIELGIGDHVWLYFTLIYVDIQDNLLIEFIYCLMFLHFIRDRVITETVEKDSAIPLL